MTVIMSRKKIEKKKIERNKRTEKKEAKMEVFEQTLSLCTIFMPYGVMLTGLVTHVLNSYLMYKCK